MSGVSHIPKPIEGNPVNVVERKIREFDCPNPDCDQKLNITDITEGTKIQCTECNNVTWVPSYKQKWWQKAKILIPGLILTFALGIASSFLASALYDSYKSSDNADNKPKTEATNNVGDKEER